MTCRKGEWTARRNEREFRFAVDVPIVGDGLGNAGIDAIAEALACCVGRTNQWAHSEFPRGRGTKEFFARLGMEFETDADNVLSVLASLGARRAR